MVQLQATGGCAILRAALPQLDSEAAELVVQFVERIVSALLLRRGAP